MKSSEYDIPIPSEKFDGPTILSQQYEQEICHILQILGESNEEIKYSLVWDDTTFRDLKVSPRQLADLSGRIRMEIFRHTPICQCARFIRNNKLDNNALV